jgi:hypothetical protein
MRKITVLALCATSAAMAWGLATVKPGGSEPGIEERQIQKTLVFRGQKLTTMQWASAHAAWCGGELLVDTDDREILIGSCDR